MELEDAKDLLLQLAYQGKSDKREKLSSEEQEKLAVAIVKVSSFRLSLIIQFKLKHNTGAPLLCFGYLPSRWLYSCPWQTQRISEALSKPS
jgi:hypothetical protein